MNGAHTTDSQWQHLAEYRETKLQEYEKEVSDLKDQLQVTQLKVGLSHGLMLPCAHLIALAESNPRRDYSRNSLV